MVVNPLTPPRPQLSKMAGGDPGLIRALEELFRVSGIDLPGQIAGLQSDVQGFDVAITANTLAIATASDDIATLSGAVSSNTDDILVNTANIASNLALIEEIMAGTEIAQAERVVFSTYGDVVSVAEKAKNLNKFGTNSTVSTTYETVAQFQGSESNETFVTTNIIDSIVSSSTSDTTQTIVIEGHTVDGLGNLTFVVQDAVLNGQTEVALTSPLARASRIFVKSSGAFGSAPAALVGVVSVYDNTGGITAGVPNVASATKIILNPGVMQSNKCQTAVSASDYWFITEFTAGIGGAGGSADRVTFKLEMRDIANGGPWLPLGREIVVNVGQDGSNFVFSPLAIIPKNHDVRVSAKTNTSTAEVFAEMSGYLAKIV